MRTQTFYETRFTTENTPDFSYGQRYEECQFHGLDLTHVKLNGIQFSDCEFVDCNLEHCLLVETALQVVRFESCRLLGLDFTVCSPLLFEIHADDSKFSICSFYDMSLKNCSWTASSLDEVEFSEANLQDVVFDRCGLSRSVFNQTDLRKTDFRTSYEFKISPQDNQIKGALFSKENVIGLLSGFGIVLE